MIKFENVIMTSVVSLCFMFLSSPVHAIVRYDYIGSYSNNFFPGFFSESDHVTAYFTMDHLPTSGAYHATDFLDYGVQIGSLSLTKSDGADSGAYLDINPLGEIISWSFVVGKYTPPYPNPAIVEAWLNSADLPPGMERIIVLYQNRQLGWVSESGTWSAAATTIPEPRTMSQYFIGLIVLGVFYKKYKGRSGLD